MVGPEPVVPGYWGAPTSSVDWCEANYEVSHYVSEWFNSLSSLVLVAFGVFGVLAHRRLLELRFSLVYACLALVGIGSAAFHGTLLFELQILDELPMLYMATALVYIVVENRKERRFGSWFPMALGLYLLVATYGDAFTRGVVQFWSFQISFATLELFGLYRTYRIYRASKNPEHRLLFRLGMSAYLFAILLWFIDLRFCDELVSTLASVGLPNLQLHAWWHVLVGFGSYSLILVIAFERLQTLGRGPILRRHGFIWRLHAGADAAERVE